MLDENNNEVATDGAVVMPEPPPATAEATPPQDAGAISRAANVAQIRKEYERNLTRFSGVGLRAYLEMLATTPRDEQHQEAIPLDDVKAELEKLNTIEQAEKLLHHG